MKSKWEFPVFCFLVCLICPCSNSYSVLHWEFCDKSAVVEDLYEPSCLTPPYIATVGVKAIDKDTIIIQEQLTMYNWFVFAQKIFGNELTIKNIR